MKSKKHTVAATELVVGSLDWSMRQANRDSLNDESLFNWTLFSRSLCPFEKSRAVA